MVDTDCQYDYSNAYHTVVSLCNSQPDENKELHIYIYVQTEIMLKYVPS